MPGIVGLITELPRERAERELQRMVESIRHESFYVSGTWIDEVLGVYVGWVARKGSFDDAMPLRNEKGDLTLVFSGEDFAAPGIAQSLKGRGHAVDPAGPSYLVHLAEEDKDFPVGLNGRFHGLLMESGKGIGTLFNDRYGMHRIYYHQAREAFYFAAEAKAILAVRPELRWVDPRGLGELVSCGCALENRTVFKDIFVLPPAAAWTFRQKKLAEQGWYFDPKEWEDQTALEPEPYYQQLREIFSRNLPRYFEGSQRIGVSLTGGLDSRMIMAWRKDPPGSLPCYSFGGMFRDCQDVIMARKVAETCGQPHQLITVADEFLSRFAHYSERTIYLTDACCDISHSSDLYINERAREIAPVRMTGNYGGEVLRRVRAFKPVELPDGLLTAEFSSQLQLARETYSGLLHGHPLSFAVFRQAPWHHYSLLALEQTQVALRSPYLDNEFVRTVFRAPQSTLTSNDISLRLIADGSTALRKIRTDRGLGGNGNRLQAAAVHQWLEFTFKAEYAYDYGMPQWVASADHLAARLHLERLFLGRHKFYHFRLWYRDFLANYVREILLDSRTLNRPYINRAALEKIVSGHLKGDRNYTTAIHKMLALEHLHRLFIDGSGN
jgi:asparagine synthase (glutamine-hydrolysing)